MFMYGFFSHLKRITLIVLLIIGYDYLSPNFSYFSMSEEQWDLSLELCSLQPCWRPGPCTRPSDLPSGHSHWCDGNLNPNVLAGTDFHLWGSHRFLVGSYPPMVRLVASTKLKRLQPTGRCGATRRERNQKLDLTDCDESSLYWTHHAKLPKESDYF